MKKLGKVLLWTLGVIVVLLLASPLWLGPAAKGIANSVVPGIVGTDFRLGRLCINQYTGRVCVGDMQLANPEGFSKENCVELGSLDVDLAMTSVLSKKIRIESIELDGLLVATTMGGGNFMKIADNASGGEASEEAAEDAAEKPVEPEAPKAEEKKGDEGVGFQIDRLVLKNITVKYGSVPVPIPTISLEGIGADKPEGATLQDVWNAIYGAVMKAAGAVGDLGAAVGNAAVDAIGGATDAVGNVADKAADKIGDATEAVSGAAGKAMDKIGDAGDAAIDAAGKAAEKLGEAAGKATDLIKGVFR